MFRSNTLKQHKNYFELERETGSIKSAEIDKLLQQLKLKDSVTVFRRHKHYDSHLKSEHGYAIKNNKIPDFKFAAFVDHIHKLASLAADDGFMILRTESKTYFRTFRAI